MLYSEKEITEFIGESINVLKAKLRGRNGTEQIEAAVKILQVPLLSMLSKQEEFPSEVDVKEK